MDAYSRPLSPEAKAKLIDFVEQYIRSLQSEYVDKQADIAKAKALEVLQTDIDILVFIDTINILYSRPVIELVEACLARVIEPLEIAVTVVEISEAGHKIDKRKRMADRQ